MTVRDNEYFKIKQKEYRERNKQMGKIQCQICGHGYTKGRYALHKRSKKHSDETRHIKPILDNIKNVYNLDNQELADEINRLCEEWEKNKHKLMKLENF